MALQYVLSFRHRNLWDSCVRLSLLACFSVFPFFGRAPFCFCFRGRLQLPLSPLRVLDVMTLWDVDDFVFFCCLTSCRHDWLYEYSCSRIVSAMPSMSRTYNAVAAQFFVHACQIWSSRPSQPQNTKRHRRLSSTPNQQWQGQETIQQGLFVRSQIALRPCRGCH